MGVLDTHNTYTAVDRSFRLQSVIVTAKVHSLIRSGRIILFRVDLFNSIVTLKPLT